MRRKAVLFIIVWLSISTVDAQRLDTVSSDSKQQYLGYIKKRSTYKTLGWVLLGTGAVLFSTAYLIHVANGWNGEAKGESLVIAGITSPPSVQHFSSWQL